jgi:hypothetical protein
MVREFIPGSTRKFMMENLLWAVRMASVSGQEMKVRNTWVNGKITKSGVMEFISGLTVTSMKENGLDLLRTDKVLSLLLTKMSTQDSIEMVNQTAMVSINGYLEPYLQVNSLKV